jgi:hypothetical protein
VSREVHAGICESRRVKLPPATRRLDRSAPRSSEQLGCCASPCSSPESAPAPSAAAASDPLDAMGAACRTGKVERVF